MLARLLLIQCPLCTHILLHSTAQHSTASQLLTDDIAVTMQSRRTHRHRDPLHMLGGLQADR